LVGVGLPLPGLEPRLGRPGRVNGKALDKAWLGLAVVVADRLLAFPGRLEPRPSSDRVCCRGDGQALNKAIPELLSNAWSRWTTQPTVVSEIGPRIGPGCLLRSVETPEMPAIATHRDCRS